MGLSAVVGYGGKMAQDWWTGRNARQQARRELRTLHQQQFHRPLLSATRDLLASLDTVFAVYRADPDAPSTPADLAGDFRELYLLRRDEIPGNPSLLDTDGNEPRDDQQAVQRLRRRMCYQLNLATSILYRTARYLAQAGLVHRHLGNGSKLAPSDQGELAAMITRVRAALAGPDGAGIFVEQQDSIAEMMIDAEGLILSHHDFRQRLLDLPGWEQFTALLYFFISEDDKQQSDGKARLFAKLEHEVSATTAALQGLEATLVRICSSEGRRSPRHLLRLLEWVPQRALSFRRRRPAVPAR